MLKAIQNRTRDDKGFTLIELMVVVLIIAILIAIAIPTFLGMRRRAQDRAAQSDLRNGYTAAKAFFTDDESYTGFTAAVALESEPSLDWEDGPPAVDTREVGIDESTAGTTLQLLRFSQSGTVFCIQEVAGVPGYGSAEDGVIATAQAACDGTEW
jgi:type IV pilus assembly protein PilA